MICKSCKKANVNSLMFQWDGNREWYCWNCGAPNESILIENIDKSTMKRWAVAGTIMADWGFTPRTLSSDILNNIRSSIAGAYLLGKEDDKPVTNNIPVQTSVTIPVEKMLEDIRKHYTYLIPIFQKVLQGKSTDSEKIKLVNVINLLQELGNIPWNPSHSVKMSNYNQIGGMWVDLISNTFFKDNPNVNKVLMSILNDGKSEIVWVCNNVKVG
jgi:hypothetical protein